MKNEKDGVKEDLTDAKPVLERTKSMPERQREKTALSLRDAEKVKVDVYVPDDKTNIKLQDTVTVVKSKTGKPTLEKAKTDVGITRPASSKQASVKQAGTKAKSKKKKDKAKGGGKGGSKDKKGTNKKKK